jgi:hypothetical protein
MRQEMIVGMDIHEARSVTKEQIADALGGLPSFQNALLCIGVRRDTRCLEGFRMIAVAMSGGVDSSAAAVVFA